MKAIIKKVLTIVFVVPLFIVLVGCNNERQLLSSIPNTLLQTNDEVSITFPLEYVMHVVDYDNKIGTEFFGKEEKVLFGAQQYGEAFTGGYLESVLKDKKTRRNFKYSNKGVEWILPKKEYESFLNNHKFIDAGMGSCYDEFTKYVFITSNEEVEIMKQRNQEHDDLSSSLWECTIIAMEFEQIIRGTDHLEASIFAANSDRTNAALVYSHRLDF